MLPSAGKRTPIGVQFFSGKRCAYNPPNSGFPLDRSALATGSAQGQKTIVSTLGYLYDSVKKVIEDPNGIHGSGPETSDR